MGVEPPVSSLFGMVAGSRPPTSSLYEILTGSTQSLSSLFEQARGLTPSISSIFEQAQVRGLTPSVSSEIEKILGSTLIGPSSTEEVAAIAQSISPLMDESMARMKSLLLAIDELKTTVPKTPTIDDILSQMSGEISRHDEKESLDVGDTEELKILLEESSKEISKTVDKESFLEAFRRVSPKIQNIIFFILLYVVLDVFNSVSADLITSKIQELIQEDELTDKEKVRKIKKISAPTNAINALNVRFISAQNVNLRKGASRSSEIIALLDLGQIVTVISKKRNWIEVECEFEDREILRGWVFSRYTNRFKNIR